MMNIEKILKEKLPVANAEYRAELERVCSEFYKSGLADSNFMDELGFSDDKFWSRMSEALIFDKLKSNHSLHKTSAGPDFQLLCGGKKIWVEVVCPKPTGLPQGWLIIQPGIPFDVPHSDILLRWTSVIKDKAEKFAGYLQKEVVSSDDICVIAVNGVRLRNGGIGGFPELYGISQLPYAVEAVFPVGPSQIHIDRHTRQPIGRGYQERFHINKSNGSNVPTFAILDHAYVPVISAILAVDFNGVMFGGPGPSALVHNPKASQPLPRGTLDADVEFFVDRKSGELLEWCPCKPQ